jgi:L-ribulose-5-phosphate 3-epimerase
MKSSMDRRGFLKSAGAVTAAVMAGPMTATRSASAGPNAGKIKKAVALGMIREKLPLIDKLKLVKDLGFEGIEVNCPTGVDNEELKKALETTGLGVSQVVDGLHWKDHLSSPNEDVRARGVAALKASLDDAKFFGAGEVLLVPGVVNANVTFDDCYKRTQEEIKKVLSHAKETGVKIGIENVWNNFINDPETMLKYVDEFQSEYVAVHYDVGNHVKFNKPEHWVRTLGKRIIRLHIKEFSLTKQFSVKLGEGDVNWPEVVKALDEIKYTGWATAEVAGGDRKELQDIAERMNKILQI